MKKYTNPKMEISSFNLTNIVTASGWVDGLKDEQFNGRKATIEYGSFVDIMEVIM